MITNLTKHAAALVNRAKLLIASFLLTEDGGFLLQENGARLILTATYNAPLTNQIKHGV